MASTITLNGSMTWAMQFVRNRPLGLPLEPAISSANLVKSTILSPPFVWRWNRLVVGPITLTPGTQDNTQAVSSFGWIESGSLLDQSDSKWHQLSLKTSLELDSSQARPEFVAAQMDDNAGNITFRFQPVPDVAHQYKLTLQQKPSLFTLTTQAWGPIPDEYSHIYNWGFLALMFLYADDSRFTVANQKFVSALLSVAQGLTQSQVNIFLNNWQSVTGAPIAMSVMQTQGEQARGV